MQSTDCPVWDGPQFVGYMHEDDLRDMLRRKQGRLLGAGTCRRRMVIVREFAGKARALCNTSSQSALSTTQREELYSGFRKNYTDQPMTVNPITVLRRVGTPVMRNYVGTEVCELVPWKETDRFPRNRLNQDHLPPARFGTFEQARAALSRSA